MKNSMFILSQAGSGDGYSLGGQGLLRLEKLIYVHVPVCFCYRQPFPASLFTMHSAVPVQQSGA